MKSLCTVELTFPEAATTFRNPTISGFGKILRQYRIAIVITGANK